MADQILDRDIAQPLPLLAAGAILPCVVHALAQRVRARRPQPVEKFVGRLEAAAFLDGIVHDVRAKAADRESFGRIADVHLHPADRAPFEAFEDLAAGSRLIAAAMCVQPQPRFGPRPRVRCGAFRRPFAGKAFGARNLDDLTAACLDLDTRMARHDAPEIEQQRNIASGQRMHDRRTVRAEQIVGPVDRVFVGRHEAFFVDAPVERQVRRGDQPPDPDNSSRECAPLFELRDAARQQNGKRTRFHPAIRRFRSAAARDHLARNIPISIVEIEFCPLRGQFCPVEILDEPQRMIGLRHVPGPRVALRATPLVARRNANRFAAGIHMAIDPQPAVAEGWLPHALRGFVERRVEAVSVHQNGDDIASPAERAARVVSVITLIKRAAPHGPAPQQCAVDEQPIAAVDGDRKFRLIGRGREFDDFAEEKPPILFVRPSRRA